MLSSSFTPAIRKKSVFLLAAIALVLSCRMGMTTHDPGSSVEAGTRPGGSESRSLSDAPLPSPVIPETAAPKARSNAYYPNAPLKRQIATLRDAAEKGDRHAECVLSRALLLCRKGADDSLLTPYSNRYLACWQGANTDIQLTTINHQAKNQCRFVDAKNIPIPVTEGGRLNHYRIAAPASRAGRVLYFSNDSYRLPPVLKSRFDFYFFLKAPSRI